MEELEESQLHESKTGWSEGLRQNLYQVNIVSTDQEKYGEIVRMHEISVLVEYVNEKLTYQMTSEKEGKNIGARATLGCFQSSHYVWHNEPIHIHQM